METLFVNRSKKTYMAGIDRGVLYLGPDLKGIAWTGLISIESSNQTQTNSLYFDGIKLKTQNKPKNSKWEITAYNYPKAFDSYFGLTSNDSGVTFYEQSESKFEFGLSYRTFVIDPYQIESSFYQIHILYNLKAMLNNFNYTTISNTQTPSVFSWSATSRPEITTYLPTSHIILDSRLLPSNLLSLLESILYGHNLAESFDFLEAEITTYEGSLVVDPAEVLNMPDSILDVESATTNVLEIESSLPKLSELLSLVLNFDTKTVIPNKVRGISELISGGSDFSSTTTPGVLYKLPSSTIKPTNEETYYTLGD